MILNHAINLTGPVVESSEACFPSGRVILEFESQGFSPGCGRIEEVNFPALSMVPLQLDG